ncbi:MAG TPA: 8-oxo-dGTP diphosphatase [Chthoniobacterales bacterium]
MANISFARLDPQAIICEKFHKRVRPWDSFHGPAAATGGIDAIHPADRIADIHPTLISRHDWSGWTPKHLATLCFVLQGSRVLLIRKKRGLGAGKINGVGGKLEAGETPLAAIHREAREELGITLVRPEPRGLLHFQFEDGYGLLCTAYVAFGFEGQPVSTAEADPLWFTIETLPFSEMWEDDRLWLPQMLQGRRFRGYFFFAGDKMQSHLIEWQDEPPAT